MSLHASFQEHHIKSPFFESRVLEGESEEQYPLVHERILHSKKRNVFYLQNSRDK